MPPKKKKKRRRGRGQAGGRADAVSAQQVERPDPNEKRRERLEARREAKAQAAVVRRRREARNRLVRWIAYAAVAAVLVWFFFFRGQLPNVIAGHQIEDFDTFTAESQAAQLHSDADQEYPSTPPVSGVHTQESAACGTHATSLLDENMVHTLEHGAVGILFKPEVPPEQIEDIEAIVNEFDTHVFSAPYAEMDNAITVVAWAHLMRLDEFEEDAIREFIDVFREGGDAPEEQDCDATVEESFEPGATPTATTAPSPTGGGD